MDFNNYSFPELESMNINKGQLADKIGLNVPGVQYDNALPNNWLEDFLFMYANNGMNLPYVASTTFWVYIEGEVIGRPVSGCTEVQALINDFYA